MEHPVKVAFCPIYFGSNGGQFTPLGKPIFDQADPSDGGIPIRGLCDRPYDCGTCPHMHQWVQIQQANGWTVGWECFGCLKPKEKDRVLPGFYHSGNCTKCNSEGIVLQLVLRKPGG
jgi:hypothetical protein